MINFYNKYLKYKQKYLALKTTLTGGENNNKKLAKYLSDFMKKHKIDNSQYAIIAGYCVAKITDRQVTDLDVISSKKAYLILTDSIGQESPLSIGSAEISKTPRLFMDSPYGQIEFFEREDKGFPSVEFSLKNLQKNKMLD